MYRQLDPLSEGAQNGGPSRDWHAIAAKEPVYRQENQLMPKRMPVTLAVKERPRITAKPVVDLPLGRVPVLVRSSNDRPIEAGVSADSSTWGVSDPGRWHRADSQLAADGASTTAVPAPTWGWDANLKARLVMIGVAAGFVAYMVRRNKQQGR